MRSKEAADIKDENGDAGDPSRRGGLPALALAVVLESRRAIERWWRLRDSKEGATLNRLYRDAMESYRYLHDTGSDWPLSFETICDLHNVSPDIMREGVLKDIPHEARQWLK